jgi:hypothetical protein
MGLVLCQGLTWGQPAEVGEDWRDAPPENAVVLDPVGRWRPVTWRGTPHTSYAGLMQDEGVCCMVVAEPGKRHPWRRPLASPIDPQRYPMVVMTYRATGILPSNERLLWMDDTTGAFRGGIEVFYNRDLQADGEVHEAVADLRDKHPKAEITILRLYPHCKGPEPAVFELLGLRFEAENEQPPMELERGPTASVQVIGEDGAPVAGANVVMDPERLNWSRSAMTDAAGKATVQGLNNQYGRHALRVSKEGMVPVDIGLPGGGEATQTVRLRAAARYGGTVSDEEGKPVSLAVVRLELQAMDMTGGSIYETAKVLSDGDGRWQTEALPRTFSSLTMTVEHPDYVSGRVELPPANALHEGTAKTVLKFGLPVRGLVVGPGGNVVDDATVSLNHASWTQGQKPVNTDETGGFGFPHCVPGKAVLLVQSPQYAPALMEIEIKPDMDELLVELEEGGVICARVVDGAGNPVQGVHVRPTAWRSTAELSWEGVTNAEGRFVWHGAPKDAVQFQLYKGGYTMLHNYRLTASDEERTITMGEPTRLKGTVTDAETGEAIKNCLIVPGLVWHHGLNNAKRQLSWQNSQAQRVTDGTYDLSSMQRYFGTQHAQVLRAEAKGYGLATSPEFAPGSGLQTYDFKLTKGPGIAGRMLLPDGKPAAGAKMALVLPESSVTMMNAGFDPGNVAVVETEADGEFWLPLPEGEWRLAVSHPDGYGEYTADDYLKSTDLKLVPWGRIEGVFRIGTGPASNREVCIRTYVTRWGADKPAAAYHRYSTKTDAQGKFVFDRVAPGGGVVSALVRLSLYSQSTSGGVWCDVAPGETSTVEMGGMGRPVVGKLVLPEAAPAEVDLALTHGSIHRAPSAPRLDQPEDAPQWQKGAAYRATKMQMVRGGSLAVRVAADGTFRVEDVPAGDHVLHLSIATPIPGHNDMAGKTVGAVFREFTVPEMKDGRSDEPLDLGKLPVSLGSPGLLRRGH